MHSGLLMPTHARAHAALADLAPRSATASAQTVLMNGHSGPYKGSTSPRGAVCRGTGRSAATVATQTVLTLTSHPAPSRALPEQFGPEQILTRMCMRTCVHTCVCTCICTCMYAYVCACVPVCARMCACMPVHARPRPWAGVRVPPRACNYCRPPPFFKKIPFWVLFGPLVWFLLFKY